ncbi:MAG: hypothetical protein Q9201_004218 [Fulgogasparrea decipioides]
MASQAFPDISTTTRLANGTTYNYVYIEPKDNKPFILFLHGFPSSSYDWRHQIRFFQKTGYGVIAPDLLGYGGTDKPSALEAYRLKVMSDDIAGILDHHQIKEVLAVGHDWGSALLSRMANYHPERIAAYAFLDVGYWAPVAEFDIDAINKMTEEKLGYSAMGYWHFFNAPDSAKIMVENLDTSVALIYPADPKVVRYHFCPVGATREFYEKKTSGPLPAWISPSEIATYRNIFSAENGGFRGGLNWYRAQIGRLNATDEKDLPPERHQIHSPTLLVTSAKDYVGVPAMQEERMRPFAKDLEVQNLDCGHWVQLEKANEVNEILKKFFDKHQGAVAVGKL